MDWNTFNFENAANALVILLAFIASIFGLRRNSESKKEEPRQIELAGAIIDKRQAEEIVMALSVLGALLQDHARLFRDIHEDLKEARFDLRELVKEIIRASK